MLIISSVFLGILRSSWVQEPAPSKCAVRGVRGWVVSDEGHRWSVKLDVRDLGGHLDTTFHGWSSTLASRVRLVISRIGSCLCSPVGLSWSAAGSSFYVYSWCFAWY